MIKKIDNSVCSVHKARFVISFNEEIYENGYVLTEAGRIKEIGRYTNNIKINAAKIIDYGDGAIMPSPVNVHTHLELSALKDKLPKDAGFKAWVKELLARRNDLSETELKNSALEGIKEILCSGSFLCGDISSLNITDDIFLKSELGGVFFREFLGETFPEKALCGYCGEKKFSYAGHAPHTTSPFLLSKLKNETKKKKLPFSIHLSESEDEIEFITTAKGEWARFLKERGIDFKNWDIPAKSPVVHLEKHGILDSETIAVHMTMGDEKDYEILKKHGVFVCICPRSNENLHKRLPDINSMINAGLTICLGTDSLASVDSLNLFDEMKFIAENFLEISPEKILEIATINGAKAIGFDEKYIPFIYIDVKEKKKLSVIEHIVTKGGSL